MNQRSKEKINRSEWKNESCNRGHEKKKEREQEETKKRRISNQSHEESKERRNQERGNGETRSQGNEESKQMLEIHEQMTIHEILRKQDEEATKRGKRGSDEAKKRGRKRRQIIEETRASTKTKPRRCEDRDNNSNDKYDHDCDETDGNDGNVQ